MSDTCIVCRREPAQGFMTPRCAGCEGEAITIGAGKRLGVEESEWLPSWFVSWSPRNDNQNAEGYWCQWVHLARLILDHPLTARSMPEFHLPYPDPDSPYDGHMSACQGCDPHPQEVPS